MGVEETWNLLFDFIYFVQGRTRQDLQITLCVEGWREVWGGGRDTTSQDFGQCWVPLTNVASLHTCSSACTQCQDSIWSPGAALERLVACL